MRRYSEAVRADVRRPMSTPQSDNLAWFSEELGIHVVTLYNLGKELVTERKSNVGISEAPLFMAKEISRSDLHKTS